jgi:PAS domain S-box-containing protein
MELGQQKKDAVQRAIMIALIAGLFLVVVFASYVFRSSLIKHRINQTLTKQKDKIEKLNAEYQAVNEELLITNSALVETKRKVEESEEKLRLVIKNSNDILVLVNEKGEQVFVSDVAKNLTGFDVNELLGSIETVIYPDDLEIVRQHWQRVLANKNVADVVQYRHKHKKNEYVWFEAVTQNFLDHPAIKSVVATVRDITERKKVELALHEFEAAKAKLLKYEIERINLELETNQKSMTAATLKLIQNSELKPSIG